MVITIVYLLMLHGVALITLNSIRDTVGIKISMIIFLSHFDVLIFVYAKILVKGSFVKSIGNVSSGRDDSRILCISASN